jgi:hypothetical protein
MSKVIYEKQRLTALVLCLCISLASCAFIGGYSARSHEYITSLKAANLKIIADNTSGPGKKFSSTIFESDVNSNELKFQEAIEYSTSLQEGLRTDNIKALHEIFLLDAENIRMKNRLLTKEESALARDVSEM